MNLMESGLRWLVMKRIETSSVSAVYRSQSGQYEVRAVPCKTDRVASNDDLDLTLEDNSMDFIVPAEDLPVDPVAGDRITARGKVYEVNNFSSRYYAGIVAWRWCEGCYEAARRIHVKFVGDAE